MENSLRDAVEEEPEVHLHRVGVGPLGQRLQPVSQSRPPAQAAGLHRLVHCDQPEAPVHPVGHRPERVGDGRLAAGSMLPSASIRAASALSASASRRRAAASPGDRSRFRACGPGHRPRVARASCSSKRGTDCEAGTAPAPADGRYRRRSRAIASATSSGQPDPRRRTRVTPGWQDTPGARRSGGRPGSRCPPWRCRPARAPADRAGRTS